jgi:putative aldouronate transport system substrate-binding protein
VTAFVPGLQPPPTPLDQNPAWQEVNRQLNATFTYNLTPFTDYSTKLATLMAGTDLPDVISFYGGYSAASNVPTFLERSMADLGPHLAGDAAREYPNLAAIPTFAWKNAGSIYNGHLYLLPIERYLPGTLLLRNVAVYDREIGPGYVPKDADDFQRVLRQLNRPNEDRWATGSFQGVAYDIVHHASVFGAPNNWRLNPAGSLTKNFETEQFKAAAGFVRDLVSAACFIQTPCNTRASPRPPRISLPANGWSTSMPLDWAGCRSGGRVSSANHQPTFCQSRRSERTLARSQTPYRARGSSLPLQSNRPARSVSRRSYASWTGCPRHSAARKTCY